MRIGYAAFNINSTANSQSSYVISSGASYYNDLLLTISQTLCSPLLINGS